MDRWHCPKCRYSNIARHRYCNNCNFIRGSWECQNCHYPKNFNERQTCYNCSSPRRDYQQYTSSRDSKKGWICPCGFHNYNDRTECSRCNGRWICSDKHCGSDNYGYRTHCFVCRRPKSNTSAYSRISNEESSSSRRPNDEVSSSRRPNEEHSSSRNKSEKNALKEKEGNATTKRLITGDGEKLQITLTNTTPSSKSTDGKSSRNSSDEIGTKSRRHTLTQEIKRRVNSGDKTNRRRRLSAEDTKRRRDKSGVATRSHSHDSKRRRHNSDNTDLREKIDKAKLEDLKNLSKKLESNKSGKRQMKNSVEREGKRSRACTRSQERATSKRGFLKDGDKEFGFDSLSRNESPCKSSFLYNFNPNKLPPGPCVLPPLPPRPKPIPHNRTPSDDKESAISTAETTSQTTSCYQDTISHDTDITDVTTKYLSIAKEISTTNAFETEEETKQDEDFSQEEIYKSANTEVHSVFKVLQQLHGESKSYDENKTITKDDIYEPQEMDVDEKMRKRKDGAKNMDNAKKRKHDSIEPLEEETKTDTDDGTSKVLNVATLDKMIEEHEKLLSQIKNHKEDVTKIKQLNRKKDKIKKSIAEYLKNPTYPKDCNILHAEILQKAFEKEDLLDTFGKYGTPKLFALFEREAVIQYVVVYKNTQLRDNVVFKIKYSNLKIDPIQVQADYENLMSKKKTAENVKKAEEAMKNISTITGLNLRGISPMSSDQSSDCNLLNQSWENTQSPNGRPIPVTGKSQSATSSIVLSASPRIMTESQPSRIWPIPHISNVQSPITNSSPRGNFQTYSKQSSLSSPFRGYQSNIPSASIDHNSFSQSISHQFKKSEASQGKDSFINSSVRVPFYTPSPVYANNQACNKPSGGWFDSSFDVRDRSTKDYVHHQKGSYSHYPNSHQNQHQGSPYQSFHKNHQSQSQEEYALQDQQSNLQEFHENPQSLESENVQQSFQQDADQLQSYAYQEDTEETLIIDNTEKFDDSTDNLEEDSSKALEEEESRNKEKFANNSPVLIRNKLLEIKTVDPKIVVEATKKVSASASNEVEREKNASIRSGFSEERDRDTRNVDDETNKRLHGDIDVRIGSGLSERGQRDRDIRRRRQCYSCGADSHLSLCTKCSFNRPNRPRKQESTWKEFKKEQPVPSSDHRFDRSYTSHDRLERSYNSHYRVERSTTNSDRSSGEKENMSFYRRSPGYLESKKEQTREVCLSLSPSPGPSHRTSPRPPHKRSHFNQDSGELEPTPRETAVYKQDNESASQSTSTYGVDLPKTQSFDKEGNKITKKVQNKLMSLAGYVSDSSHGTKSFSHQVTASNKSSNDMTEKEKWAKEISDHGGQGSEDHGGHGSEDHDRQDSGDHGGQGSEDHGKSSDDDIEIISCSTTSHLNNSFRPGRSRDRVGYDSSLSTGHDIPTTVAETGDEIEDGEIFDPFVQDISSLSNSELRKELATSSGKKKEMLLRTLGIDSNHTDEVTPTKSKVGAKQNSSGPKDVEKEKQQEDCPAPSYVTLDSDDDELGKYSPCGSDDLQWLEEENIQSQSQDKANETSQNPPQMPAKNVIELNDKSNDSNSRKSSCDTAGNIPNAKKDEANVESSSQCDSTLGINENMTLKDLKEMLLKQGNSGIQMEDLLANLGFPSTGPPKKSSRSEPTAVGSTKTDNRKTSEEKDNGANNKDTAANNKNTTVSNKDTTANKNTTANNKDTRANNKDTTANNKNTTANKDNNDDDDEIVVCLSGNEKGGDDSSDDELGLYSPIDPDDEIQCLG